MGPFDPATERGNKYIYQAVCPFSDWTWLQATPDNDAETAAHFLLTRVFFDLAGFPAILYTDRGPEYTGLVVQALNKLLNVEQVFGAAYHPEHQGPVEAMHKRPKMMLRTYTQKFPRTWDLYVPMAQWCLRATPRDKLAGRTPFEVICGMVPQGPLEAVLRKTENFTQGAESYVMDLLTHLKNVHNDVGEDLRTHQEKLSTLAAKRSVGATSLEVGQIVLVKRPPEGAKKDKRSRNLQLLTFEKPLQVKTVKGSTFELCDPLTGSTEIGIGQPVHISRLVPIDLADVETPLRGPEVTLKIVDRNGVQTSGRLEAQAADGRVMFQPGETRHTFGKTHFEKTAPAQWLDLSEQEYFFCD